MPSWSQVGLSKGSKRHVKVTSKLSLFCIEFIEFWTPPEGRGGMGKAPSGDMGKLLFGIKDVIFPLVFKGFAKSCLCARNEEVT